MGLYDEGAPNKEPQVPPVPFFQKHSMLGAIVQADVTGGA